MSFNMFLGICLLSSILLATIEGANTRWYELESKGYNHDLYMIEFGKHYSSENERIYRKNIFDRKLFEIKVHNKRNLNWKEGVNYFTDRTSEELMEMSGYRSETLPKRTAPKQHILTGKSIPYQVDYRKHVGVLTGVKDQGNCGSCWAVSSASTVESQYALATGITMDFSIQQIASCTNNPEHIGGYGGCKGGNPGVSFQSIIDNEGLSTEWTYPYRSYNLVDFPCIFEQGMRPPMRNDVRLSSYVESKPNDYEGLMDAVANVGPLSILIDSRSWHHYESGILNNCNASIRLDHAVQLVGYGSENGVDYWILRNSWAAVWGEGGFMRLFRQAAPPCDEYKGVRTCGACGVLGYAAYPIILK